MNTKLIKLAAALGLAIPLAFAPACDSDEKDPADTTTTTQPDVTSQPDGDTTTTTTTPTDTVVGDTSFPDIETPAGSVKALKAEAAGTGCDPSGIVNLNPSSSLTGVVVTSPRFVADDDGADPPVPTLYGHYVADVDGGPFSGVPIVFEAASAESYDLQPGDIVDVTGELTEFFCLTQLNVDTITEGTPVAAPTPVVITGADVAKEENEGRLVKVEGVTISETVAGGVYRMNPGNFVVSRGGFPFFFQLEAGKTYDITGVITYNFNEYKLVPRSQADVINTTGGTDTAIAAIQTTAASTGCTDPPGGIQNFESGLQVSGVVTVGQFSVNATLAGYYLSDGTQSPNSGISLVVPKSLNTDFAVGDMVTVLGDHVEFFCNTQIQSVTQATKTGTGTVPAPISIGNDLSATEIEMWEGAVVELSNVTVTGINSANTPYSETDAGIGIDGAVIGQDFTPPAMGTVFATVRGPLRFSRGAYRISPRSAADLIE